MAARVRDAARGPVSEMELIVPLSDGRTINILENRADILERTYENESARLKVRIGQRQIDRLRAAGAQMRVVGEVTRPASAWRSL